MDGVRGGRAKLRKGLSAASLQGVVRVAALPLHQGLAQAAGVCVSLTAAVLTDVICGVSVGDKGVGGGHGRGRESSTCSERCPGMNGLGSGLGPPGTPWP